MYISIERLCDLHYARNEAAGVVSGASGRRRALAARSRVEPRSGRAARALRRRRGRQHSWQWQPAAAQRQRRAHSATQRALRSARRRHTARWPLL